ncbi:hypothetical protein ABEF95_005453 [Exophiala dermatitidis]
MPGSTRPTVNFSRHRRKTSSTTSSNGSNESTSHTNSFGSSTYRSTTLEPNNIIVEHEQMDDERWCRLAFALGMPYGEIRHRSPETVKFAQQLRTRKPLSGKAVAELLAPLLASLVKRHKLMRCRGNAVFHPDGVPDSVPDIHIDKEWKMHLPTPNPAFALGYSCRAFTSHQLELQQGIIANSRSEPCDLHKLSQPTPEVYWPFFVVEAQEQSMVAARNACAGSAATCNNALMIFAGAAHEPAKHYHDMDFLWSLSKAAQSFSLAIHGKKASLNTHSSEGCLPHAVAVVRTYQLDDEKEVEAMAARISSILVWAENSRLRAIGDLLGVFDQKVRLAKHPLPQSEDLYTPSELMGFGVTPRSRMSIIKGVLADSVPRWAREF